MEIAVVSRLKQGYIYRYMQENGLNVRMLAEKIGLDYATMLRVVNFQWIPSARYKTLTTEKLEYFFNMPIDVLFPPELTESIAKKMGRKYVKMVEMDLVALEEAPINYLTYDPEESQADDIDFKLLDILKQELNPREREVIEARFTEERTLEDIAQAFNVTRSRVQQIENKAIRRLRGRLEKRKKKAAQLVVDIGIEQEYWDLKGRKTIPVEWLTRHIAQGKRIIKKYSTIDSHDAKCRAIINDVEWERGETRRKVTKVVGRWQDCSCQKEIRQWLHNEKARNLFQNKEKENNDKRRPITDVVSRELCSQSRQG